MRILIAEAVSLGQRERLLRDAGADQVAFAQDFEVAVDAVLEAEVVFGNPSPTLIAQMKRLVWIQLASVGFDEYRGITWSGPTAPIVTNLGDSLADQVAQTAMAGILALVRGIDRLTELRAGRRWDKDGVRRRSWIIDRPAVLFIGYGSTNRRLAELLAPFHPEVATVTSSTTNDLDALLPTADLIVAAVPETDHTIRLLDERRLKLLKQSAILVNLGRGSAVAQGALIKLLESGSIAGAVLDVTDQEPIPNSDPIWSAPNLILTQHSAGGASDEMDRKLAVFLMNLARLRAGEPLLYHVELDRGY